MGEISTYQETTRRIRLSFSHAKRQAEKLGHPDDFRPHGRSAQFTETDLIREAAWVILCAGFRERTVRQVFPKISICFCNWESAVEIFDKRELCLATALDVFGHKQKLEAIISLATRIHYGGFERLVPEIDEDPIKALQEFRYVGPVTAYHLAKNLGYQYAKPDRHLVRATRAFGFSSVDDLCLLLSDITKEPISVVDGVIWRLSALGLIDRFKFLELSTTLRRAPQSAFDFS